MRKLLLALATGVAAVSVVTVGAAASSRTVRLTIVHVAQGCHVWGTAVGTARGPSQTLAVKRGTRVQIRVSCSMAFDFVQVAGPALALGDPRTYPGTVRTLVFPKRGLYKLQATNVESSADAGLPTLGADNILVLVVRVS